MKYRKLAVFLLAVLGGPAMAGTFSFTASGTCGISENVRATDGISESGAAQCNNLTSATTGNLLGSRSLTFDIDTTYNSMSGGVFVATETTDLLGTANTGGSIFASAQNAQDTLSFVGGPSEFELIIRLDYVTDVSSTFNAATFTTFNFGAQRVGGTGGTASDVFKVVDYASRPDLEIFDDDEIRLLINSGATVNLSAALGFQATSGSLAGQNDQDEAQASGKFAWSLFTPDGVEIVSTSGFDYNQPGSISPVPLPAGGVLLVTALGALAIRRRRTSA